jgi:hypothetical protein
MIPMSKIRLPKVVKLVREFESIAKEFWQWINYIMIFGTIKQKN